MRHAGLIVLGGLLLACGAAVQLPGDGGTGGTSTSDGPGDPSAATGVTSGSTSTSAGTTSPATTDGPSTTGSPTSDAPTTGPSDDSTSEPPTSGVDFIVDPDSGSARVCSVWDQNCPPGQKCIAYADDGGNSWNATWCSPIDPDPDADGEPCTVEGSAVSGIDSCEIGSMCWYVDSETLVGECVPLCVGSEATPLCEDPGRSCSFGGDALLTLCLMNCNPLAQDCDEDEACYGVDDDFQCAPDASGKAGADGDPCEYINGCDPGLGCFNAAAQVGCEGASGCCSLFCDVMLPETCTDPMETCVAYFELLNAPPGLENVGFCGLVP